MIVVAWLLLWLLGRFGVHGFGIWLLALILVAVVLDDLLERRAAPRWASYPGGYR